MSPSWAVIKSAPGTKVPPAVLAGTNPKHGRVTVGAVHQGENCGVLGSENFGASAAVAMNFSVVKDSGVFCRAKLWVLQ